MRKWLLAVSSLLLALWVTGCAHQAGGYAYGGGGYLDECEYWTDCYGGPQYTCVFVQPSTSAARMEINLARHSRPSPRVVNPRDGGSGSSSSSASAPASAPASVSREPVVVASPSVDRGSPRVHN